MDDFTIVLRNIKKKKNVDHDDDLKEYLVEKIKLAWPLTEQGKNEPLEDNIIRDIVLCYDSQHIK